LSPENPSQKIKNQKIPKFFDFYKFHENHFVSLQGSPSPRANGDHSESRDRDSIGLNGDRNGEKAGTSKLNNVNDRPPSRSGSSSSRSTPNLKTKDVSWKIPFNYGHFTDDLLFAARQAWHPRSKGTFNNTKFNTGCPTESRDPIARRLPLIVTISATR
jgi:hypothetical protein